MKLTVIPKSDARDMMKLGKEVVEASKNLYVSYNNISNPRFVIFAASVEWDEVVVEMSEDPELLLLLPIVKHSKKITPIIKDGIKVGPTIATFLATVYPEKSAKIRLLLMSRRDVREVL
jgi:hypothetical protein